MKKTRLKAYTLLEMLTVVGLMGAFTALAGPVTLYLIHGMQARPKIQDQLFLVSRVSDKIRSDLKRKIHETIRVELDLLRIGEGDQAIEYRVTGKTIERLETQSGKLQVTSVWKVPYSTLSFSSQQGTEGFIVVDLDWQLSQPGKGYSVTRETKIPMEFTAQTVRSVLSIREGE